MLNHHGRALRSIGANHNHRTAPKTNHDTLRVVAGSDATPTRGWISRQPQVSCTPCPRQIFYINSGESKGLRIVSGEYHKPCAGFVWSFWPEATVYRAAKHRQRYTRNAAVNALPLPNGWEAGSSHLPQGWWIVRPGNSRSWNMHARNASRRIPVWMNHLTRNTCRAYVMFLFAALAMFAGKMTGWWMDGGKTLSGFFFLQGISDCEPSLESQRKRSFTFPLSHSRD